MSRSVESFTRSRPEFEHQSDSSIIEETDSEQGGQSINEESDLEENDERIAEDFDSDGYEAPVIKNPLSKKSIDDVADELAARIDKTLLPIEPEYEKPNLDSNCQLEFEVPFQIRTENRIIVCNRAAALRMKAMINLDKDPSSLQRFVESNFPNVNKIYLKFTVGASWAGRGFSHELAGHVSSCAQATLAMMKKCEFVLDIEYPWPKPSKQEVDLLVDVRTQIMDIFRNEARILDPAYKLEIGVV